MIASTAAEPYVGLRPYDIDDKGRFFGRTRESWELTSLLLSSRLVVVYGPPAVGKTSLIRAGVLSQLGRDLAHVLPVGDLPLASSLASEATPRGNPFTFALASAWLPDVSPDEARVMRLVDVFRRIRVEFDRYGEAPLPLVAVVDQFEEAFRGGPDLDLYRDDLIDQLGRAVDEVEHLHLVLSMQQDVVGELLPHEQRLSAGNRRRYRVEPLDRDAALDAITGPLQPTGRSFAPGVAETLVDQLRTTIIVNEVGERRKIESSTVEPIKLQVVCSGLWHKLPEDIDVITADQLEDYGNVEDLLTDFCINAAMDVAAREDVPIQMIWEWLEKSFVTDLGTRGNAYEGLNSVGGMPIPVARAFEEKRILRSEARSRSVWFELLYDGLIGPIRRARQMAEGIVPEGGPVAGADAYLRMAERALHSGDLPLAEQYAQGAVRASEQDVRITAEANWLLGKLMMDQGQAETGAQADEHYEKAATLFRRAAELLQAEGNIAGVGRVLASLGRALIERGQYEDAADQLRSALERSQGDVDIRLDFARALMLAGQPTVAMGQYTAVLSFAPDSVEALVGRGTLAATHDDPRGALRDLDEAVRLDPDQATRPEVVAARSRAFARLEDRG